jgi:hypothetical protein
MTDTSMQMAVDGLACLSNRRDLIDVVIPSSENGKHCERPQHSPTLWNLLSSAHIPLLSITVATHVKTFVHTLLIAQK